MNSIAIYPGTFDPITNGHIDLVKRSLYLFEKVIVAIAKDTQKKSIFTQTERIKLAKNTLSSFKNVEICPFSGFLVKFAKQKKAKAIIRGLRAISDFEYEFQLAGINRQLAPQIQTIFLTPGEQHAYISSSMVRWMAELGGNITPFVPSEVAKALNIKYSTAM